MRTSVLNVGIRSAALVTKLIFLIMAGRHLAVEDMALYGLMIATVGIAVTLLGLEFYAFSTRELLARDAGSQAVCLRDQFAFHALAYLCLFPLCIPVFVSGVLPWSLAVWFLVLALGEHLSQEVTRIFNALFRPIFSTFLFFLRSAAWGAIVAALWLWHPEKVDLNIIFAAWLCGIGVSLLLAGFAFRRLDWRKARNVAVDWTWIRTGLLVAGPFIISAASARITELADRYIIHFLLGNAAVGVYSFYSTLANVIPALIGAAISAILVPHIIRAYQAGDMPAYLAYFRRLNFATGAVIVVAMPVAFLAIAAVQPFIGKLEYAHELPTFAVLLLSTGVGVIAQLPGVALYARRDDIGLLLAVVGGAIANTALNFILIPVWGIAGAAWATTVAYGAVGTFQWSRLRRLGQLPSAAVLTDEK